jgi:hypothetical protein
VFENLESPQVQNWQGLLTDLNLHFTLLSESTVIGLCSKALETQKLHKTSKCGIIILFNVNIRGQNIN